MTVRLRGLCWDHPRCVRPMAAATRAYQAVRPDVRLEWDARPLAQFNDQPVWDVPGDYDLIFVDHPTVGAVAARQALAPLDTVLSAAELAGIGARSVGGSHGSYEWDGHQWALGVDAACQVAAYRADRLTADVPATWDDVLAMARSGSVALSLYPSDAFCALMSLSANASLAAGEPATWLHPDGAELLVELAGLVDPWCYEVNPPALLDAMAGGDREIAYVPLVFGYATLSRPPLRFADVAGVDGRPRGAVLGGAGLAVFPASRQVAEAAAFGAWCLGSEVQRDVVLAAGGQPADRRVWDDPASGDFFAATRRTMDTAFVRPREPWWPECQRDAGRLLVALLRDGATAARVVRQLTMLAEESSQAAGFPTAPQGNVTQTSHKHVTKQNLPSPNATNTLNSGEAGQPWVDDLAALVGDVADRTRLGVSGFHFTRAPVAALRALADTGVRDLHYISWGGGLPLELLLGRGAVSRATLCFASLDVLGPAPRFRRAVESGALELDEWTALGIINGFRAAGENLAFEVLQEPAGSSLAPGFSRRVADPYGGDTPPMSAVPPLPLDVLLLHAQRADDDGNVELAGARGLDMSAIFAAERVYVTVEERVPRGSLGAPRSLVLPRTFVSRVALAPFGAYPTSCLPHYPADFRALREIVDAGRDGPLPDAALQPNDTRAATLTRRAALPATAVATAFTPVIPPEQPYTTDELMVCVLARTIGPTGICSVGAASPLPTAAYLLAKHLWAPGLLLMSHNGGLVDPPVRPLSLSCAEFLDHHLSAAHTGGDETYHWYYQRGLITHEVVGAAQVDGTGATNNLWVSKQDGTPVRLPGQGGMADVANLHANFMIYLPRQSTRNLVAKVGTVSARRVWHDPSQRRRYGLRPGDTVVLTDLGTFGYDNDLGALTLRTLHPGADLADLRERTGFDVPVAGDLTTTEPPTAEELAALRTVVDPLGVRRLDLVASVDRQRLIDDLLGLEERTLDNLLPEHT